MASFTEPFELLQLAHSRSIYIEPIEDESSIVLSSKENGVIELNLESSKVNQSWAAPECRDLNTPAIFDRTSAAYYCVMNEKELLSWKKEDPSLTNATVNLLTAKNSFSKLQSIVKGEAYDILLFEQTGKVFLKSKLENLNKSDQALCTQESNRSLSYPECVYTDFDIQKKLSKLRTLRYICAITFSAAGNPVEDRFVSFLHLTLHNILKYARMYRILLMNDGEARYIWSNIVDKEDPSHIFVAVVTEEVQKYSISVVMLKKTEQCFDIVESCSSLIDPNMKGCHIISCTIQKERLITLWSDNAIRSYELPSSCHGVQDTQPHGSGLTGQTLLYVLPPEFKVSGKGLSKAKVGCIDFDHLYVISKCIIDDKMQGIISIINTKFGTEQARTTFPLSFGKEHSSLKDVVISSALYWRGKFIIALTNCLIGIDCNVYSSSLASALGKLKSRSVVNSLKSKELSSPSMLVPNSLKRSHKDAGTNEMIQQQEIEDWKFIEKLGDPSKTRTVKQFSKELTLFLQRLRMRVKERLDLTKIESPHHKSEEPARKRIKKHMMIPKQFVDVVVKRCVEEDTLWSSPIPLQLLGLKCISPRQCSDIIAKSLKTKSVGVLQKCFESIKGIYDKDIVRCIQFTLCQKVDAGVWKCSEVFNGETLPDLVKIEHRSFKFLLVILNYSFNEYSMREMLRNLSSIETKEILQVLFELITRQMRKQNFVVGHSKVIDWISMIIDAKFTTIILSSDLCCLVKLIKETVGKQMQYFEKLQQLEPYLLQLERKYKLPANKKHVAAYSVETIAL